MVRYGLSSRRRGLSASCASRFRKLARRDRMMARSRISSRSPPPSRAYSPRLDGEGIEHG